MKPIKHFMTYGFLCYLLFNIGNTFAQEVVDSTMEKKKANRLINETSPYLLQHAYNPVDWYPWGDSAFVKAKRENKPVIVSIGYSSCHWCHVMEHQSFEDKETAKLQNDLFISIKVDREERPDVDQIYMEAIQAMGQHGGWPLNVFVTPDGKPFFGGTYFPNKQWKSILKQVSDLYHNDPENVAVQAEKLTQYLQHSDTAKYGLNSEISFNLDNELNFYQNFEKEFDTKLGGAKKTPKFPLPNTYHFLLSHYYLTNDSATLNHVSLTLNMMAWGGIYDQIGGGFSRYSTDNQWIVPHFEKMLYDNAQLVSLYTEAYTVTKDPGYKDIIFETLNFIEREMTNHEGGFYSALDADSEGEEGKYYVWSWDELYKIIGQHEIDLFSDYYNIKKGGNWEGRNILYRKVSDDEFIKQKKLTQHEFHHLKHKWKHHLLKEREKRERPSLDDKILTAWNGLMLKAYSDAYRVFGDKKFLHAAIKNAEFITSKMKKGKGLYRTYKDGKASIDAFLEDYALVVEGLISLYQATFEEKWLKKADQYTKYAIEQFYDEEEKLFFFTANNTKSLIARKKEIFDNVISSSNSVMAANLHFLSHFVGKEEYRKMSHAMLAKVYTLLNQNATYLSNWASLYIYNIKPTAEIAIVGKDLHHIRAEIDNYFVPNKVIVGTAKKSDLPLLQHREELNNKTTIYVCFNNTCKLPVWSAKKAMTQLPHPPLAK